MQEPEVLCGCIHFLERNIDFGFHIFKDRNYVEFLVHLRIKITVLFYYGSTSLCWGARGSVVG
jgi:hypothetical protein